MQQTNVLMDNLALIDQRIGRTPIVRLKHDHLNLSIKLEHHNFMGSIKDRAALWILRGAIERGELRPGMTVIEASSGNFALSCSAICHFLGLHFVAVIDPSINPVYEKLIRFFSPKVIKVTKRDRKDGFLLTKLEAIQTYRSTHPNVYWTNQYENPDNFNAHFEGTGREICDHYDTLDYAFLAVASGGTISGTSSRLKQHFPKIKIIAVDTEGSVIFGGKPKPRLIPGMGSGIVPPLVKSSHIDEVVTVREADTITACHELFHKHALFCGGSTGTVYRAIQQYFADKQLDKKPRVVFISPDRGIGYADSLYNNEWLANFEAMKANAGRPASEPVPI